MHIPDGFLSTGVILVTGLSAGVGVAASLHAERQDPEPLPAGLLGAMAAFIFAAQMINVPVAPAVSGHLVGGTLVAALMGPWRAITVMTVVLAVQALLFQDGGITALGANIVDMGFGGVLTGYAVLTLVARWRRTPGGLVAGSVLGAFAATLVAATLTAVWLGLSGLYPLAAILPVLLSTHAAIGVLEAALTGAVLATVLRWRPDLVRGASPHATATDVTAAVGGVLGIALAVAGFAAPFASSLPDGLEHAAHQLGFADRAAAVWPAPLPDYVLPAMKSAGLATALAGIGGAIATAVIAWVLSRGLQAIHGSAHD